jgi:cell division transport system permease protein
MAIKADYVIRETFGNFRRNITLTAASVAAIMVSLSLVGWALLLRQGVDNATQRWKGGIEFIVFMKPDATTAQMQAMSGALDSNPQVKDVQFTDQQEAFEEFQRMFANQPDMVEVMTPEVLPTSYRVIPQDPDPDIVAGLANEFEDDPGVYQVLAEQDTVRTIDSLSSWLTNGILLVAGVLMIAAVFLVLNTIRMAMFARRREIEVMKLVGATNWFIRIPFMLEGLMQGLVGALVAVASVYALNAWLFTDRLSRAENLRILQGFTVASDEVTFIVAAILAIGVVLGTVGSGVAVTRFLDV